MISGHSDRWAAHFITAMLAVAALASVTAAAAPADAPSGVVLQQRGYGWVLTDEKGMSIYVTVRDQQPSKSTCTASCAETWPPVAAPGDAQGHGEWSIVTRDDGSKQWAFEGHPLYRYSNDQSPGDSYGDDLQNAWSLATKFIERPSSVSVSKNVLGYVLVDSNSGATLYYYEEDEPGRSSCDADCVRVWSPHEAPRMANARGDWTIVARGDGIRQWAYKGRPLYRYSGDLTPGEAYGHGGQGGKWQAAILEPLAPLMDWVRVQASDAGLILSDQEGRTLYGRTVSRIRNRALGAAPARSEGNAQDIHDAGPTTACVECPRSYWRPVIASDGAKPSGNWSLVNRDDGRLQWAYKGEPLYTNTRDTWAGALNGVRSGDRSWHALMRSGQQMQGTGN